MSQPSSAESRAPSRRPRFLRPVRLSTSLLVMVVIGLLIALYVQHLREARLRDAIALYRTDRPTEEIIDVLEEPMVLGYADGAPLDEVLEEIKRRTSGVPRRPKLPRGLPIYVDPIGLQEAEVSMNSRVKKPPAADTLPLGVHLRRILEPMGLTYTVKDGFMMITSKDPPDVSTQVPPAAPAPEDRDPYRLYRDVLR